MSTRGPSKNRIWAILLLAVTAQPVAAAQPLAKITVEAGEHTRIDTPISVPLSNLPALHWEEGLRLEEIKDYQHLSVPVQIEPGNPLRLWWILSGTTPPGANRTYRLFRESVDDEYGFGNALENGRLANEGFRRCHNYVEGWLTHADPRTGLIPKGLKESRRDFWNAQDAAADNYAFMVLTAAITDCSLFHGRMLDMLRTETKLTSRIGAMPDTYSFSKQTFTEPEPDVDRIIFGSSEYVKDGLLPLTEWLGKSPWSQRMLAILDDMWKYAPIETKYGKIVSDRHEVNGEMLQTLSRVYWMTGDKKYVDWALRLGDYYLLDKHHPTRDETKLRLRDHGCEIISGLCELYATVNFAMPQKKRAYQEPIHQMLDRILEVGVNEHGLLYNSINPQAGEHEQRIADTWGYNLNGFYTVYLIDKTESYRRAVLKALSNLNDNYRNYRWEGNYSADGFADSIESAINLYNREPVPSAARWIDSETKIMWSKQRPDGVIEGWHGDGNFARTTIMYCLWKTKGLTIRPWRKDVVFGAIQEGDNLKITMLADKAWKGRIVFDTPRHKTNMNMPLDWPRINQFPEWFTVETSKSYTVRNVASNTIKTYAGSELLEGIDVGLKPGIQYKLSVSEMPTIEAVKNDAFLELRANGKNILRYNHAPVPPPRGADLLYTRSAFIHPLWSPTGAVLTDIHPPDHVHHMGIWMPWTKTEFEGRKMDFWNLKEGKGTVRFSKFLSTTSGPVYGGFVAQQEHVDLSAPTGEKVVLDETWDVRAYNIGDPKKSCWLWDFVSTQCCAANSPLHHYEYRYGGLGFRATRQWTADNSEQLTSKGKTREDGNRTRARWCDTYGQTRNGWAGVTVMSHPENFRHPEPMRLWPKKHSHLFFNFAPSQLGDWTMEPGKNYVFRYRFYVHKGKPVAADLERLWNDFADPPKVKLEIISD
ncbi:MAG: DUF6807 domain-containing protein [Planctomycetota bacterium]|jgi:hypothetical protein